MAPLFFDSDVFSLLIDPHVSNCGTPCLEKGSWNPETEPEILACAHIHRILRSRSRTAHHSPSSPSSPPACTDQVKVKMASEGQAEYESILCVKPEVNVYRIPPRASNRAVRWETGQGLDGWFPDPASWSYSRWGPLPRRPKPPQLIPLSRSLKHRGRTFSAFCGEFTRSR